MLEPRFCFWISPEAGIAYDAETGENAGCYTQIVKLDCGLLDKDEYEKLHESFRESLAEQLGIEVNLIERISQDEYYEKVSEED